VGTASRESVDATVREILRLKYECGNRASDRAIDRHRARSTVAFALARFAAAKLHWLLPATLTDRVLEAILYPSADRAAKFASQGPESDWTRVHRELRPPGITLMLPREEYRACEAGSYNYSLAGSSCTADGRIGCRHDAADALGGRADVCGIM
jgi:hypothetical protein